MSLVQVDLEYKNPHSQERLPGDKVQHMWSQSLLILCNLLEDKFINIGEIDPLNRRLSQTPRPDTLVQGRCEGFFGQASLSPCMEEVQCIC